MFVAELPVPPTPGGRVLGVLGLADTPRPEARDAIAGMRRLGLEIVMLTGDSAETADAIRREVAPNAEISRLRAGVLPGHKAEEVRAFRSRDGWSRWSATASTTRRHWRRPTWALPWDGSDIAIEAADITLMRADLHAVSSARIVARHAPRDPAELFWAFVYNVLGIPIAAGVLYPFTGMLLNPMVAAAAMSLSSVSVLANSLRLRRRRRARVAVMTGTAC